MRNLKNVVTCFFKVRKYLKVSESDRSQVSKWFFKSNWQIIRIEVYIVNYNGGIKEFFQRAEVKEQSDENSIQEDKHFRIGAAMQKEIKCEDATNEDEELLTSHENAILALCAICHLTLGNINSNLNQNVFCSKGHALCQRCTQRFAIQSDPGCILCHAQHQQSCTNLSRDSNVSLNSSYGRSKKQQQQMPRPQSECQPRHHQRPQQCAPTNFEQSYNKCWNQNYYSMIPNTERNTIGYYNDDFEETLDYEQIREQQNVREERKDSGGKQRQSCCNLYKKGNRDLYEAKVNGQITAECSRRPIRCPRIDCAINVAFSALTHHFIFDHPEVPILNVEPGIKSTLIISFSALSSGSSRCLALLLVSGKLSEPVARLFNGSQINPKYRNRLPLPVLAARLHSTDEYTLNEKIDKQKSFEERDIIIAWVAGLDIGNSTDKLLCSIQAVDKIDNEGLRSLTYTGPVNSLRTAQCPRDIFSTGDCIVLHEGLLSHITSDCATLNVNVTVH
ncbi:uncharacterized protein LOC108630265 [Ceratina calcarata]|uniref:Uncharacterized protein LOC108630265 n=1 Tax=Ceratina calcarata TaxID=156304 RepID=A0AAJ7JAP2_9HYME|nr:uncharacterized protein LOC108630265 [Ceratina calcarata]